MKAIRYTQYGPPEVLQMADLPKPAPRPNEVLVKIRATTVTIGDCRMRSFTVPREQWLFARLYLGVFRPRRRVLGMELAGDIEAVGAKVTRFKPGDPVFASTFEADWGGYAEYKCFPENGMLAPKPANLEYGEAAAAVGGGQTALRCLRQAKLQPGQTGVGLWRVRRSGDERRSTGAQPVWRRSDRGVQHRQSRPGEIAWRSARPGLYSPGFHPPGPRYDVVFDAVAKFPAAQARQALKPGGIYLNVHRDAHAKPGQTRLQEILELKDVARSRPFQTGHRPGLCPSSRLSRRTATWNKATRKAMWSSSLPESLAVYKFKYG